MLNRPTALLVLAAILSGCQSNHELFPVSEHSHWTYLVRTVNKTTDSVSYAGKIAVGNTEGFELHSDLGSVRLAWVRGQLVTDEMAGSRMTPPLPMLTAVSKQPSVWRGWIDSGDKREAAKATITTVQARLSLDGNSIDTTRTLVSIMLPNRQINLTNWYKAGVGLVRQEQRTNGRLDLILDYLDQS